MRSNRFSLIVAVAAIVFGAGLKAQEQTGEDFDPFDVSAFESGVQVAVESEDSKPAEYLFGATFVPSSTAFASQGFGGYLASGSISGKAFAKLSSQKYGSIFVSYGFSHQVFQSRGGDVPALAAPAKDLFSPTFTLAELHYSFDIAKVLFFRIGNQLIAWGPSRIWTPVDFVNPQKMDSFQAIDTRAGRPSARLHLPLEGSNLFAFADFSNTVASGTVRDLFQYANLGLRYDIAFGGFEFGITGYGGMNAQLRAGIDFSGRILGATAYGEAAFLPAYDSYAFSWSASLGVERKLGQLRKATLSAEVFYNSSGEDDESDYSTLVAAKTFSPMYVGKLYAYAGLALDDFLSPDLSTAISITANLSDGSFSLRLAENFDFRGMPPFSLILGWTGGGDGKAFTYFSGTDALSATVQARIDF